jgi:transglutaminase-like putative cysteine protease
MTPTDGMIAPNGSFNGDGSISGAPQRTVYFEKTLDDPSKPSTFTIVFEYTAYAYYPKLDDAKAQPLPAYFPKVFLAERLPHISFTPALKAKVREIVGDETNPLARARKIFIFIDQHIAYNAEVEYCTVPSFSERALERGRGDCGIQATLFITMCRAAGIPARWQSGWETKRVNNSMHDWAEFYVAPWGWLPADVSYGTRNSGAGTTDEKVRNFYFGHQDAYRWIVNLDYGSELQPPAQSFRSEPADFQKGEVELDGKNLYYDAWDFDYDFEYLDGK